MSWMTSATTGQLVIEAQGSLMAPLRTLFLEGQATGEFAEIDPVDATTAVMGALSMVAMHHTVTGDFDPHVLADTLIPWLLDGLRSRGPSGTRRPGVASRRRARGRGPVAG